MRAKHEATAGYVAAPNQFQCLVTVHGVRCFKLNTALFIHAVGQCSGSVFAPCQNQLPIVKHGHFYIAAVQQFFSHCARCDTSCFLIVIVIQRGRRHAKQYSVAGNRSTGCFTPSSLTRKSVTVQYSSLLPCSYSSPLLLSPFFVRFLSGAGLVSIWFIRCRGWFCRYWLRFRLLLYSSMLFKVGGYQPSPRKTAVFLPASIRSPCTARRLSSGLGT